DIAELAPDRIEAIAPDLRTAGETWKLPDAYLALAKAEPDDSARVQLLVQAEKLGSAVAGAMLGKTLLDTGLRQNQSELVAQGIANSAKPQRRALPQR
ncbi:MAG: hypothetical protein ACOYMN_12060, partial [Roseimicrobium sp.]